jgi:hypothetical protein
MFFASPPAGSGGVGMRSAGRLLRAGSLSSMARAVGVMLGAGLLAASYHVAYEEGRAFFDALRTNGARRRNRNDAVLLVLMATELPLPAQDRIRRSRDAFRAAMALVTDLNTPEQYRTIIRTALIRTMDDARRD